MHQEPALPDPGQGDDPARRPAEPEDPGPYGPAGWEPVVTRADWMSEEDWNAWCASPVDEDEPLEPGPVIAS